MKQILAIAACTLPLCFSFPSSAQAMPLQPGSYSWASKYIQIAKKGDRWCYQGSTARASLIASLSADPKSPDLYRLHNSDLVIRQDRPDQISFGSKDNLLPYNRDRETGTETEVNFWMRQCLNSKAPYYKQQTFRR